MTKPTYTYRNGSIYYGETKVLEQWAGDREGIEAMIRKANAAFFLWDALDLLAIWLRAALGCKEWSWDWDQKEAAVDSLRQAEAALASYRGEA
jgi:hypothetical protein